MLFHICLIIGYLWCHYYLTANENRNCKLDETKLRYPGYAGLSISCAIDEDVCFVLRNCGGNKNLYFPIESENFPHYEYELFFPFPKEKTVLYRDVSFFVVFFFSL